MAGAFLRLSYPLSPVALRFASGLPAPSGLKAVGIFNLPIIGSGSPLLRRGVGGEVNIRRRRKPLCTLISLYEYFFFVYLCASFAHLCGIASCNKS